MDLAALQAADVAARTSAVEIHGRRIKLRLPRTAEIALAAADLGDGALAGPAVMKLARTLLAGAVTGWEGVQAGDLVPGLPPDQAAEPVPFSAGALDLLLAEETPLATGLRTEFLQKVADRRAALESLGKN